MGVYNKAEGNTAVTSGVEKLNSAEIRTCGLRVGAILVLVGLTADGVIAIPDIHSTQRGYKHFEEKLRTLGATIELVENERKVWKFRLAVG